MDGLMNLIMGTSETWDIYCQTRLVLMTLSLEFVTSIVTILASANKR